MKRRVITLMAAACALVQASSEVQAQTADERAAVKPGPQNNTHGGGCCCSGCAGPLPMPIETPEKHDFSSKSL